MLGNVVPTTPLKNRKNSVGKVGIKENIKSMSLAERLKMVITNKNTGKKGQKDLLIKPVFK
jgi:hypothetical protein